MPRVLEEGDLHAGGFDGVDEGEQGVGSGHRGAVAFFWRRLWSSIRQTRCDVPPVVPNP